MNKRDIRDYFRLVTTIIVSPTYIFHVMVYLFLGEGRFVVNRDVINCGTDSLKIKGTIALLYMLHTDRFFRNLFYHRIGPAKALLISWMHPGERTLILPYSTKIGTGMKMAHAYATVLNAESIGDNFSFLHCTTIGKKAGRRPRIGNNVTLGANVVVLGDITIGNNVTVGAGAVVVKDVPDNAVVVGNPARIIKYNTPESD